MSSPTMIFNLKPLGSIRCQWGGLTRGLGYMTLYIVCSTVLFDLDLTMYFWSVTLCISLSFVTLKPSLSWSVMGFHRLIPCGSGSLPSRGHLLRPMCRLLLQRHQVPCPNACWSLSECVCQVYTIWRELERELPEIFNTWSVEWRVPLTGSTRPRIKTSSNTGGIKKTRVYTRGKHL